MALGPESPLSVLVRLNLLLRSGVPLPNLESACVKCRNQWIELPVNTSQVEINGQFLANSKSCQFRVSVG